MKALLLCDTDHLDAVVPLCHTYQCGLEVQAFYDPELLNHTPDAVQKHRTVLTAIHGQALHGPYGDLCAGSFDPLVRDVARQRFRWAHDRARELSIPDIVLHHGYVPGTSPPTRWLPRWVAFWKELLSTTTPTIRFHLENMLERDPTLLVEVITSLESDQVDVCLDVGHVHCHGTGSVVEWIVKLGSFIGYVHLHDNDGTADQHRGFGLGTLPLLDVCCALQEYAPQALWAIETRPDELAMSVEWLQERGFSAHTQRNIHNSEDSPHDIVILNHFHTLRDFWKVCKNP